MGTISFFENTALFDGGAIVLMYPTKAVIKGVSFDSNRAIFGGAVSLTSTTESSVELELCRFESNNASRGGALYISGEGQSFIRHSGFYRNVAGENSSTRVPSVGISIKFLPRTRSALYF